MSEKGIQTEGPASGFTDSGAEDTLSAPMEISESDLERFRGADEDDAEWEASKAHITAELGVKPKAKEKAERDERGRFSKDDEQPEAVTPARERGASDEAPEDADDQPASEEEKTKLEKALEALRRYGWDETSINGMSRKNILARGLQLAKIQADTDEMHADLRRMKAEREKATAKPEAAARPSADLAAISKALADEGISEGVGKALTQFLQDKDEAHKREVSALREAVVGLHIESARREVAESFPDLKKSDVWAEVMETAEIYEAKNPGKSVGWCIEKAARHHKLKSAPDTARAEEARAESRVKRNGTPEVNGHKPKAATVDPDEALYQGWAARLRGAPLDDAIRLANRR